MRCYGRGRWALDSLFRLPRSDVDGLALHACSHAVVHGAFETNGGSRFRRLSAEEQVVNIAGLGIDQSVTFGLNCVFDAAGTLNGFSLRCRMLGGLTIRDSAKI